MLRVQGWSNVALRPLALTASDRQPTSDRTSQHLARALLSCATMVTAVPKRLRSMGESPHSRTTKLNDREMRGDAVCTSLNPNVPRKPLNRLVKQSWFITTSNRPTASGPWQAWHTPRTGAAGFASETVSGQRARRMEADPK